MRIKLNKWYRIVVALVVGLFLVAGTTLAANKKSDAARPNDLAKPALAAETIINIGAVHNYFATSTVTKATGTEEFTFMIGHDANAEPSMMWSEGGYANNHYLYFGVARMGVDGLSVQFNNLTTTEDDWVVDINNPEAVSPYEIVFTMTDDLAGTRRKGVRCTQTVHAWSESYRDDFFIMEYDITNIGTNSFTDFYFWVHFDCDISSVGGGSGTLAFYRDDMPDYYTGTDMNGNPEYISFMYDADNPDIAGDDTGGKLTPKESEGYLGTRVLDSPATSLDVDGETVNTASGHQWWDWNSDPSSDGDFYNLCLKNEFKTAPGSPHDYRYMQIEGPFDIGPGETIHIALGLGMGVGLDGIRENLQWAYDLYWNDFAGPGAPTAPTTDLEKGDGFVKLLWDDTSEDSDDPLTGEKDFEGYRVYRSLDKTNWTLLAGYDLVNDIGENTGLPPKNADGLYEYLDEDVTNGFLYYYSIAAYDRGTETLPSLETGKVTDLFAQPGPVPTSGDEVNADLIRVVPNPFVVKAPWDFSPTKDNPSAERLQFQNVPKDSKVTVFNLAGDMIIELNQEGEDGFIDWDLITRNRQKIVSGLYLYVVEAKKGDNFIGKFVVIR